MPRWRHSAPDRWKTQHSLRSAFPPDHDKKGTMSYPVRSALEELIGDCDDAVSDDELKRTIESRVSEQWGDDSTPITVFILSFRWCGTGTRTLTV